MKQQEPPIIVQNTCREIHRKKGITVTQGLSFRDAGDMRSGAEGRCVDVNLCVTETSVAKGTNRSPGSQGSVAQKSSMSALLGRSNDQRTSGTEAVEDVRTSFTPRLVVSSGESGFPGAVRRSVTSSSGECGIDPQAQALNPDELK